MHFINWREITLNELWKFSLNQISGQKISTKDNYDPASVQLDTGSACIEHLSNIDCNIGLQVTIVFMVDKCVEFFSTTYRWVAGS